MAANMSTFLNGFLTLQYLILLWTSTLTGAQQCAGFGSADAYFDSWNSEVYSDRLYPFGATYCDEETNTNTQISNLAFSAPFYGANYDAVSIFAQGFISFGPAELAGYIPRQTWPNAEYNPISGQIDAPMLVAYYNDADYETTAEVQSTLNYRIIDPTQSTGVRLEIDTQTLELLYNDTAAAIPSSTFYPERALVVTWFEMHFKYGVVTCTQNCVNTYQAVILTDGTQTFSILNYYDINWSGGVCCPTCTACDACDPATGTGTTEYPDCFLAQMGFNRGGGLEFTPLPLSSTESQTSIDDNSGTPSPLGRFIYEVSGTAITQGGCAFGDLISGSPQWSMTVSPSSGLVLGGFEVSVKSVCLSSTDTVTCRFGSSDALDVTATVTDEYSAACVAPLLTQTGSVPVFMTIDTGGATQTYSGSIYVDPTQPSQPEVILVNPFDWFSSDAQSLELSWDPLLLNPDNTTSQLIDVSLFGYRETVDANSVLNSEWALLTVLSQATENAGTWTFLPANFRCNSTQDCEWYAGAIKLTLTSSNPDNIGGIWTEVVPLGWYVSGVLTDQYGASWPSRMCTQWASAGPASASDLIACPCTPEQAAADVGSFRPEVSCGAGELTCVQDLSDCYVSVQPSSTGAATRCCYIDGALQYSGDVTNASYSSAVHIDGATPFGPGLAPLMSHWFTDVVPYYWCCAWSNSFTTCRDNYANRRATPDCSNYESPAIAGSYGDPHMLTLDGLQYTFNGEGEFWLVRTTTLSDMENINIQARMEQIDIVLDRATVITAMVVQEGLTPETNTTRVQVEVAPQDSQNALSVLVDGEAVDFADPLTQSKEFYNTAGDRRTVLTPSDPTSVESLNIQMESGAGLSIITVNQTLAVTVYLPDQYEGATMGLLGILNGNEVDDLTNSTGQSLPVNSTSETIHNSFGLSWMTEESDSRFTYFGNMNWTYFNNPDFVPVFEANTTGSGVTEEEILAVCGDTTSACSYDYTITGDPYFAANTLNQENSLLSAVNASAPVVVCSRLDAPNAFKTVTNGYYWGSIVTFTGCEDGYEMSGTERYECLGNGQWDEHFDFECTDDDDLVLILAIVIPIVVILLIIGILAGIYIYRHYNKNDRPPPKEPVPVSSPVSMTQPNTNIYHTSGMTDLSRSTSTVNNESGIHTLSRNSIILTQELKAARPPRPNSMHNSRMHNSSMSSDNSYNAAADRASINSSHPSQHSGMLPVYDNRVYQPDDNDVIDTRIQVPDVLHTAPPTSDQPPPTIRPKEYYDNLASIPDIDSTSSDSDNEGRGSVPQRTPPAQPRPLSLRAEYPPPQSSYQPRPYSYATSRPYTYNSEYAQPVQGGGISSSFV